jgi:predicted nucleic acid-binding protein
VVLVDTSAWVEFLRDTASPTCVRVDELLEADIAPCHPIRMEVLAGARDDRHLSDLRRLTRPGLDCARRGDGLRGGGRTPPGLSPQGWNRQEVDRLPDPAVAIRADTPLLHADADYEVLARHTALRIDRT